MITHQDKVQARAYPGAEASKKRKNEAKKKPTLVLYKGNNRTDCLITCDRYEFVLEKSNDKV